MFKFSNPFTNQFNVFKEPELNPFKLTEGTNQWSFGIDEQTSPFETGVENVFQPVRKARIPLMPEFDVTKYDGADLKPDELDMLRSAAHVLQPRDSNGLTQEERDYYGTIAAGIKKLGTVAYVESGIFNGKQIQSSYLSGEGFQNYVEGWSDISDRVYNDPNTGVLRYKGVDGRAIWQSTASIAGDFNKRYKLYKEKLNEEEGKQLYIDTKSRLLSDLEGPEGNKLYDENTARLGAEALYESEIKIIKDKLSAVESRIAEWKSKNQNALIDISKSLKDYTGAINADLDDLTRSKLSILQRIEDNSKRAAELKKQIEGIKSDLSYGGRAKRQAEEANLSEINQGRVEDAARIAKSIYNLLGITGEKETKQIADEELAKARQLEASLEQLLSENLDNKMQVSEIDKQIAQKNAALKAYQSNQAEQKAKVEKEQQDAIDRNIYREIAKVLQSQGLKDINFAHIQSTASALTEAQIKSAINIDELKRTGRVVIDENVLRMILKNKEGATKTRMPTLTEHLSSGNIFKKDGKIFVHSRVSGIDALQLAIQDGKSPQQVSEMYQQYRERLDKSNYFKDDIERQDELNSAIEGYKYWDEFKKLIEKADATTNPFEKSILIGQAEEARKKAIERKVYSDDETEVDTLLRTTFSGFKSMLKNIAPESSGFGDFMATIGFEQSRETGSYGESEIKYKDKNGVELDEQREKAFRTAFMMRRKAMIERDGQIDFKIMQDARLGGKNLANAIGFIGAGLAVMDDTNTFAKNQARIREAIAETGGTDAFVLNSMVTMAPAVAIGFVNPYLSMGYMMASQWYMTYGLDTETRLGMAAVSLASMGVGKFAMSYALKGATTMAQTTAGESIRLAAGMSSKTAGLTLAGFSSLGGGLASQYLMRETLFDEEGNFMWSQFAFGTLTDAAMYLSTDVKAIRQMAKAGKPELANYIATTKVEGSNWGLVQHQDGDVRLVKLSPEAVSKMREEAKQKGLIIKEETVPDEAVINALKTYEDSYNKNVMRALYGTNTHGTFMGGLGKSVSRWFASTDVGGTYLKSKGYDADALLNVAEHITKITDPNWITFDGQTLRFFNSKQMKDAPTVRLGEGEYNERRVSILSMAQDSPANIHQLVGDIRFVSTIKKMVSAGEITIDQNGRITVTEKGADALATESVKVEKAKSELSDPESTSRKAAKKQIEGKTAEEVLREIIREPIDTEPAPKKNKVKDKRAKERAKRNEARKDREAVRLARSIAELADTAVVTPDSLPVMALVRAFRSRFSEPSFEVSLESYVSIKPEHRRLLDAALELGLLSYDKKNGKLVSGDITSESGDVVYNFGNTNRGRLEKTLFDLGEAYKSFRETGSEQDGIKYKSLLSAMMDTMTENQRGRFFESDILEAANKVYIKHTTESEKSVQSAKKFGVSDMVEHTARLGKDSDLFYRNIADPAPKLKLDDVPLPASLLTRLKEAFDRSLSSAEDLPETMTSKQAFTAAANRLISGIDETIPIEQYPYSSMNKSVLEADSSLPDEFISYPAPRKVLGIQIGSGRNPRIFRKTAEGLYQEYRRNSRNGIDKVGAPVKKDALRATLTGNEIAVKGYDNGDLQLVAQRLNEVANNLKGNESATEILIDAESIKTNLKSIVDGEGEFSFGDIKINVKDYMSDSDAGYSSNPDGATVINRRMTLLLSVIDDGTLTSVAGSAIRRSDAERFLKTLDSYLNGTSLDARRNVNLSKFTNLELESAKNMLEGMLGSNKNNYQLSKLSTDQVRSLDGYLNVMETFAHEFRHVKLLDMAGGEFDFLSKGGFVRIADSEEFTRLSGIIRSSDSNIYRNFSDDQLIHEIVAYGSSLRTTKNFFGKTLSESQQQDFAVLYKNILTELKRAASEEGQLGGVNNKKVIENVIKLLEATEDATLSRIISEEHVAQRISQYEQNQSVTDIRRLEVVGEGGPRRIRGRDFTETGIPKSADDFIPDGAEFIGSGRREFAENRIAPDRAVGEVGVNSFYVRRPDGTFPVAESSLSSSPVAGRVKLNVLDVADNGQAKAILENYGPTRLKDWAEKLGYDGYFNSGLADDVAKYSINVFDNESTRSKLAPKTILKMADDEPSGNLLLSIQDMAGNAMAKISGTGTYKLSAGMGIDLETTGFLDRSKFNFIKDTKTEGLIHINERAVKILSILDTDDETLLTGKLSPSEGFASSHREIIANRAAISLNKVLSGQDPLRAPYVIPYADSLKKFIVELGGNKKSFSELAKEMSVEDSNYILEFTDPDIALVVGHGGRLSPEDTLVHEGTHAEIHKHYGSSFAAKLLDVHGGMFEFLDPMADIMTRRGKSAYAPVLEELVSDLTVGGYNIGDFMDTVFHETLAFSTSMNPKQLSTIGIDINSPDDMRVYIDSVVKIVDAIHQDIGPANARKIAAYMNPKFVNDIYEIFPERNRNERLFGVARTQKLQEIGERRIQAAAVGEGEEGLPPTGVLKSADDFVSEQDSVLARLTIDGATVNGLPINSKDVPWQVRRVFSGILEGALGQTKIQFTEPNYSKYSESLKSRLNTELTLAENWSKTVRDKGELFGRPWWDQAATISEDGTVLLKSPYLWSKHTKDLNGQKFGSKQEALDALHPRMVAQANNQVSEYKSAIKWAESNGLKFGFDQNLADSMTLKMADDDIQYISDSRKRLATKVVHDTAEEVIFRNVSKITDRSITGQGIESWARQKSELLVDGKSVWDDSIPTHIQHALSMAGAKPGKFNYSRFKSSVKSNMSSRITSANEQLAEMKARVPVKQTTELTNSVVHWERPYLGDVVVDKATGKARIRTNDPKYKDLNGVEVETPEQGLNKLRQREIDNKQAEIDEYIKSIEWVESDFSLTEVIPPDGTIVSEALGAPLRPRPFSYEEAEIISRGKPRELDGRTTVLSNNAFRQKTVGSPVPYLWDSLSSKNVVVPFEGIRPQGEGVFNGELGKLYRTADQAVVDDLIKSGRLSITDADGNVRWYRGGEYSEGPTPTEYILQVSEKAVRRPNIPVSLSDVEGMWKFVNGRWVDVSTDAKTDSIAYGKMTLKMADDNVDTVLNRITDPTTGFYPAEALVVHGFDPLTQRPNTKFAKTGAAKGSQWLKMLSDTPGVKKEGLEWGVGAILRKPENIDRIIKLSELKQMVLESSVKMEYNRYFITEGGDLKTRSLEQGILSEAEKALVKDEISKMEELERKLEVAKSRDTSDYQLVGSSIWQNPVQQWYIDYLKKIGRYESEMAEKERLLKKYGSAKEYFKAASQHIDGVNSLKDEITQLSIAIENKLGGRRYLRYDPKNPNADWDYLWNGKTPRNPTEMLFSLPVAEPGRTSLESWGVEDLPPSLEVVLVEPAPGQSWEPYYAVKPKTPMPHNMWTGKTPEEAVRGYIKDTMVFADEPHWKNKNVVYWLRAQDLDITGADGTAVPTKHITEIQSPLQGIKDKKTAPKAAFEEIKQLKKTLEELSKEPDSVRAPYEKRYLELQALTKDAGVELPMAKTWVEAAAKSAIRSAVEFGMTRLSWTDGESQARRWTNSFRGEVDNIDYESIDGAAVRKELKDLEEKMMDLQQQVDFARNDEWRAMEAGASTEERLKLRNKADSLLIDLKNMKIDADRLKAIDREAKGQTAIRVITSHKGRQKFDRVFPEQGETKSYARVTDAEGGIQLGERISLNRVFGREMADTMRKNRNGNISGDDIVLGKDFYVDLYERQFSDAMKKLGLEVKEGLTNPEDSVVDQNGKRTGKPDRVLYVDIPDSVAETAKKGRPLFMADDVETPLSMERKSDLGRWYRSNPKDIPADDWLKILGEDSKASFIIYNFSRDGVEDLNAAKALAGNRPYLEVEGYYYDEDAKAWEIGTSLLVLTPSDSQNDRFMYGAFTKGNQNSVVRVIAGKGSLVEQVRENGVPTGEIVEYPTAGARQNQREAAIWNQKKYDAYKKKLETSKNPADGRTVIPLGNGKYIAYQEGLDFGAKRPFKGDYQKYKQSYKAMIETEEFVKNNPLVSETGEDGLWLSSRFENALEGEDFTWTHPNTGEKIQKKVHKYTLRNAEGQLVGEIKVDKKGNPITKKVERNGKFFDDYVIDNWITGKEGTMSLQSRSLWTLGESRNSRHAGKAASAIFHYINPGIREFLNSQYKNAEAAFIEEYAKNGTVAGETIAERVVTRINKATKESEKITLSRDEVAKSQIEYMANEARIAAEEVVVMAAKEKAAEAYYADYINSDENSPVTRFYADYENFRNEVVSKLMPGMEHIFEDDLAHLNFINPELARNTFGLIMALTSAEARVDINAVNAVAFFSRFFDILQGKTDVDLVNFDTVFKVGIKGSDRKTNNLTDLEGRPIVLREGETNDAKQTWYYNLRGGKAEKVRQMAFMTYGYVPYKKNKGRGEKLVRDGGEVVTAKDLQEKLGVNFGDFNPDSKFVLDPMLKSSLESKTPKIQVILDYLLQDANPSNSVVPTGQRRFATFGDDIVGTKMMPFVEAMEFMLGRSVVDSNELEFRALVTGSFRDGYDSLYSQRILASAGDEELARRLSVKHGKPFTAAMIQQPQFDVNRKFRSLVTKGGPATDLTDASFQDAMNLINNDRLKPIDIGVESSKALLGQFGEESLASSIKIKGADSDWYLSKSLFNVVDLDSGKSQNRGRLSMADDDDSGLTRTQAELADIDQRLASGDYDAWVRLATRHVQGGALSDGEMAAIKRMTDRGDIEALNKYVLKLSYMTPVELIANVGRVALLLGVKTVAKNMAGNSLRQIMDEIARMPAGVLDMMLIEMNRAMGGKNLDRSVTGLVTDPVATIRAYQDMFGKGLLEGILEGVEVMTGSNENIIFEHPSLFRERSTGRWYLKPLEIVEKYGWRWQGAMDRPFNAMAYHRALSEIQTFRMREEHKRGNNISYKDAEGLLVPADQQLAEYMALMATYQEDNPIASKYYQVVDGLPAFWRSLANTVFKFVKTPLNVMDYVLDYTGFWPLAKLSVKEYNTQDWVDWKRSVRNIFDNPQDRKIISMALSKGAFGMLMLFMGHKMGAAGLISQFFDREKRKEGEQMEAKGTSFGEVTIGGVSIDISWLTPPSFYLIAGATMFQTHKDWEDKKSQLEEKLAKAKEGGDIERIDRAEQELGEHNKKSPGEQSFTRILKNFALQTPFARQGLEIATVLEQGNILSGLAEKWFSPDVLVPNILSEIAATTDEYERVVTDETALAKLQEKIQKKIPTIPGLSDVGKTLQETEIPVISQIGKTLTGREGLPIRNDMFGRPVKSPYGLDPFKTKNLQEDKLTTELDKFNITIPPPTGATPAEENARIKQKGEFFTPLLNNLLDSDEYKGSSDKVKKKILETAVRYLGEEYREPRLQPEDRKFNLRMMAYRENLRDTLRSNPTSLFKDNLTLNQRDILSAFAGADLGGTVSFSEVISDLKRSGSLDRFLNDRLASSLLVGKGRTRRDAERNYQEMVSNTIPVLIEWWAVGKRNSQGRERNDQRRDELRAQGKSEAEIEKILRKESARRGAETRRELKSFNSVTVTR